QIWSLANLTHDSDIGLLASAPVVRVIGFRLRVDPLYCQLARYAPVIVGVADVSNVLVLTFTMRLVDAIDLEFVHDKILTAMRRVCRSGYTSRTRRFTAVD